MSGDLCVICGKGSYQSDKSGGYVGMRDVPCVCGEVHRVCFKCWTDPGCKALSEAFSWTAHTWMGKDVVFNVCPRDIVVAQRLMD